MREKQCSRKKDVPPENEAPLDTNRPEKRTRFRGKKSGLKREDETKDSNPGPGRRGAGVGEKDRRPIFLGQEKRRSVDALRGTI